MSIGLGFTPSYNVPNELNHTVETKTDRKKRDRQKNGDKDAQARTRLGWGSSTKNAYK